MFVNFKYGTRAKFNALSSYEAGTAYFVFGDGEGSSALYMATSASDVKEIANWFDLPEDIEGLVPRVDALEENKADKTKTISSFSPAVLAEGNAVLEFFFADGASAGTVDFSDFYGKLDECIKEIQLGEKLAKVAEVIDGNKIELLHAVATCTGEPDVQNATLASQGYVDAEIKESITKVEGSVKDSASEIGIEVSEKIDNTYTVNLSQHTQDILENLEDGAVLSIDFGDNLDSVFEYNENDNNDGQYSIDLKYHVADGDYSATVGSPEAKETLVAQSYVDNEIESLDVCTTDGYLRQVEEEDPIALKSYVDTAVGEIVIPEIVFGENTKNYFKCDYEGTGKADDDHVIDFYNKPADTFTTGSGDPAADSETFAMKSYVDQAFKSVKESAIGIKGGAHINIEGEGTEKTISADFSHLELAYEDKKIKLYDGLKKTGEHSVLLGEIDATDFIKDGMIESVTLGKEGGKENTLYITWNTDAGNETTEIDLSKYLDNVLYDAKKDGGLKKTENNEFYIDFGNIGDANKAVAGDVLSTKFDSIIGDIEDHERRIDVLENIRVYYKGDENFIEKADLKNNMDSLAGVSYVDKAIEDAIEEAAPVMEAQGDAYVSADFDDYSLTVETSQSVKDAADKSIQKVNPITAHTQASEHNPLIFNAKVNDSDAHQLDITVDLAMTDSVIKDYTKLVTAGAIKDYVDGKVDSVEIPEIELGEDFKKVATAVDHSIELNHGVATGSNKVLIAADTTLASADYVDQRIDSALTWGTF